VFRCIIAVSLLLILCFPAPSRAQTVKTGAEILTEEGFQSLKGKRFALVTNQSATVGGVHLLELMRRKGVQPAVIFTPEHGLKGIAEDGARLADGSAAGIPVKSLYGDTRKPRQEDLKGLDLVLFDIQDVGVRYYTFISTMGFVMQGAAQAGIPFVVLDRPNPLGGDYVSGFVRESLAARFTSLYPIPVAHGMTVGELAGMIKGEAMLPGLAQLDLSVVRMQGWQRWMRWPDTELPWVATSPNLAAFESALLYPGIGFLEATGASEGRGSAQPFCLAGWPGIDAQALAHRLNSELLPGVRFEPVHFTPKSLPGISSAPKYRNRELGGVRIEITDYSSVLPVETGVAVVVALYAAIPEAARKVFFKAGFDDMAGSELMRKGVQGGESSGDIIGHWGDGVRRFRQLRQGYLLYHD
jgi:uncharacterized protein YbbC (DUF1343 family)